MNGHVTPMSNQTILPVRSAYAGVIAETLPDKYVVSSKDTGVVTMKDKNSITVKYKDNKETHSLAEWFSKEVAGVTYRHKILTPLSKGSKVKAGDVITYDSAFFGIDLFNPSKVVMKTGVILRTEFIEDSDTFEDSIALSKRVSKKLSSPTTKVRSIVIDSNFKVTRVKEIGDTVDSLETLLIMTDTSNGEVEELGDKLNLEQDTLDILNDLNDTSPKAKYDGTIVDISIYYNSEFKDLSPSLKKLITVTDARLKEKLMKDVTGKVSSGYSIKGKPLTDGKVEIKFFIEKDAYAQQGDKFIFGNQLKGTVSSLIEDRYTESGRLIEAEFSTKSESARIVNSANLTGVKTTILREISYIAGSM